MICVLVISCSSQKSNADRLLIYWVNSYKVSCQGVSPMHCLQIRTDKTAPWQNFYTPIEGFEYEPGFIYKIKLKKTILEPSEVPQDASSATYRLVKVLEKQMDKTLRINDIWVLTHIMNAPLSRNTSGGKNPYIELNLAKKQILGHSGCNQLQGKIIKINSTTILFSDLNAEDNTCENVQSESFLSYLKSINHYTIDKGTLIMKENKKELLTFKKVD